MDIVDSQVHFNRLGTSEAGFAAMDAVGVNALMYDESLLERDAKGRVQPGVELPNGAFRPLCPRAEDLAFTYPDRIGILRRIDYRDPDLDSIAKLMADLPCARAMRVIAFDPKFQSNEFDVFGRGDYDPVFAVAAHRDIPVVVLAPGHAQLLSSYAKKFPTARIVIDHSGVPLVPREGAAHLDAVLALADHENVSLKWGHAPLLFSKSSFPFGDVIPLLRRAIGAFGAERIMWASDFTLTAHLYSWTESMLCIRESTDLSTSEKEWILGKTARAVYGWPNRTGSNVGSSVGHA